MACSGHLLLLTVQRGCMDLWYYRWHLFVVWVSLGEPDHFSPPLALLCSHPHTLSATVSPARLEIFVGWKRAKGLPKISLTLHPAGPQTCSRRQVNSDSPIQHHTAEAGSDEEWFPFGSNEQVHDLYTPTPHCGCQGTSVTSGQQNREVTANKNSRRPEPQGIPF